MPPSLDKNQRIKYGPSDHFWNDWDVSEYVLKVWMTNSDKSPTKGGRLWKKPDVTKDSCSRNASKSGSHPALQDVWCTMDGLKLYLQPSSDCTTQKNFYNGWTHDHYVGAVIVFCPDGTIPICCYNVPGSPVHDSMIAERMGNVYNKLEQEGVPKKWR